MTAQLIDGKALAAKVRDEVKQQAAAVTAKYGRPPGIAVVRVGDDPASQVYVTSKEKTAKELGFGSWHHHFPATLTQLIPDERTNKLIIIASPGAMARVMALMYSSCGGRASTQASTCGAGAGRISSDRTFVSSRYMRSESRGTARGAAG